MIAKHGNPEDDDPFVTISNYKFLFKKVAEEMTSNNYRFPAVTLAQKAYWTLRACRAMHMEIYEEVARCAQRYDMLQLWINDDGRFACETCSIHTLADHLATLNDDLAEERTHRPAYPNSTYAYDKAPYTVKSPNATPSKR